MIEIVFGESACGSLKIAQTYGKGKYRGSAVSIFMRHEDGSVPSSDEMKKAQLQAQEQERIAWENAIPLGGKSCDVYCFDMALSVGDISDNGIGEQRKNVFKKMLSVCFVEDLDYIKKTNEVITTAQTAATWNPTNHATAVFLYRFFLWLIGVPVFFDFWRIRISQRNSSSDRFL